MSRGVVTNDNNDVSIDGGGIKRQAEGSAEEGHCQEARVGNKR